MVLYKIFVLFYFFLFLLLPILPLQGSVNMQGSLFFVVRKIKREH